MRGIRTLVSTTIVAAIAGCSTVPSSDVGVSEPDGACVAPAIEGRSLDPEDAGALARHNEARCQSGLFAMRVRSIDRSGSMVYLNSQAEVWDPTNISIALTPQAQRELTAYFDGDAATQLEGKELLIAGTARIVPIYGSSPGIYAPQCTYTGCGSSLAVEAPHPSIAHYDQIHVLVRSAGQIWMKQSIAVNDSRRE